MKKRFLSGFLALVMCLGMLPGTAWAAEDTEPVLTVTETVEGTYPFFVGVNATAYTFREIPIQFTGASDSLRARLWKGHAQGDDYLVSAFLGEAEISVQAPEYDWAPYTVTGSVPLPSGSLSAGDELLLEFYAAGDKAESRKSTALAEMEEDIYAHTATITGPQTGEYGLAADDWGIYHGHGAAGGRKVTSVVMGSVGRFDPAYSLYERGADSIPDSNGKMFYFPKSQEATSHPFTLTSATMTQVSELGVSGQGFALEGVKANVDAVSGITTFTGILTVPAAGGSLNFTSNGSTVASFGVDRAKMDLSGTTKPWFFEVTYGGEANDDGTVTLHASGPNLDNFTEAPQQFVLQTRGSYTNEETGEKEEGNIDLYVGRSLTKTGDYTYDLVFESNPEVPGSVQFGHQWGNYGDSTTSADSQVSVNFMIKNPNSEYDDWGYIINYSFYLDRDQSIDWDKWSSYNSVNQIMVPWASSQEGSTRSATVQQNVTTTTGSASVAITNSGYTQMRYKVDAGAYTEWAAIPASVTIPTPSVGSYTVSFQFRAGETGTPVTRTATVTRQSAAVLAAPVNVGIADNVTKKIVTPGSNGTYPLMGSHDYLLYADLADVAEADKTSRTVQVNGQYSLYWNSTNKRYEGTLNGGYFDNVSSLVFQARQ